MTKEQTPPLVSDELALQCKNEADEMYPPHLAPDEVIGDHFMLVRYAVANALYNDRQKTREVVQALVDAIMDRAKFEAACDEDGAVAEDYLSHTLNQALALAKSQLQIEPTKP